MAWHDLVKRWSRKSKLDSLADAIAVRKQFAVWEQICHRVGEMTLAEARGYVRARSACLVYAEVDATCRQQRRIDPVVRRQLIRLTADRVVEDAMDTLRHLRQQPMVVQKAA